MPSLRDANPAVRRFRWIITASWLIRIAVAGVLVLLLFGLLGGL
ncbi:MAG TPA: hypothetical protein VJQ43_01430 [Thermoplasmata archaeon]|nr:hypothetical protein [Thermoplasmata archaeon]